LRNTMSEVLDQVLALRNGSSSSALQQQSQQPQERQDSISNPSDHEPLDSNHDDFVVSSSLASPSQARKWSWKRLCFVGFFALVLPVLLAIVAYWWLMGDLYRHTIA